MVYLESGTYLRESGIASSVSTIVGKWYTHFCSKHSLAPLSLSPLLFPTQSNLYYRSTDQVVKPYLQAHLGREEELEKVLFKHSDSDEEETKID